MRDSFAVAWNVTFKVKYKMSLKFVRAPFGYFTSDETRVGNGTKVELYLSYKL